VTQRQLWGLVLGASALIATILCANMPGHAAVVPGRSRLTGARSVRALEPGFSGTFLYRNDNFRTGQNLAESILTPSTVTSAKFGLLFTDSIDGAAYAQPLYVPNVSIPGLGTHNVVYVATSNDSVYAFDADQPGPPLWQTSFINPSAGITAVPATDLGACGDLVPIIGITATPVIDPVAGTLYVVSKVKLGPGSYQQQLHALDITTGLERANSPVTITAQVPGTASDAVKGVISFNPLLQMDRPALTLANGVVYLSFASHCDIQPYHGWILGYDQTTLAQEVVFNSSANGDEGGFWEAGCGPGVDTNGDLIAITGNGTFDTGTPRVNYGDSFLRLTPGAGTMSIASFFTPLNELLLDDEDLDMGSGGNLLLPDQPGPNPHLMIGAGKVGTLYLVNRDSMGGFNAAGDQMVQELPGAVGGMFSTPAYWQGTVPTVGLQNMIYTVGVTDLPKMFVISNGLIQTPPVSSLPPFLFAFPGASPVISANGTTGGILWAIDSSAYKASGKAVLYAFDATNLALLYNSNQFSTDNPGPAVKFTVPTVANGSVYMGTQTQLAVFGLFPGARGAPTPTATATDTATATNTATPTPTASITATPTDSATPTGSPTPTASSTAPTDTPTPTASPTPTVTATMTPTLTATPTGPPTPTASPTPVFATLNAKPASLSFASQIVGHQSKPAKVTVINTAGTASVVLWPPTVSAGFVVTSNNCPSMMPPGGSCTITIASAPTSKGKQKGLLQLNSNASYGLHTIKLKGKGVAPKMKAHPKSLTFEAVSADAVSSAHTITLVNDSPAPISFSAAPAATPPFNVTANTCATIAPNGGTCTIAVEFAPHQAGKYHGILELQSDAAGSPQHIKLFGSSK
jgi:Abnormal spindle-like microcephaly-assoc'd, ASPM-SPD-2-Hydin